jgi:hypothetical protein
MDTSKRKNLKNAYKDKTVIGGVYCIRCDGNNHVWIKSTTNMEGQRNRFEFARSTNSCPEPGLRTEWLQYGASSFTFSVLEQLVKKDTQTDREFADEIDILLEMFLDKKE